MGPRHFFKLQLETLRYQLPDMKGDDRISIARKCKIISMKRLDREDYLRPAEIVSKRKTALIIHQDEIAPRDGLFHVARSGGPINAGL